MDGKRKPEKGQSSIKGYHGEASTKEEQRTSNNMLKPEVQDHFYILLYFNLLVEYAS
jgi:hypothetical protein